MAKKYTVSDGKLVLTLEEAEEGGYVVTSPMWPGLVTEAEDVHGAFMMARDALKVLRRGAARLARTGRLIAGRSMRHRSEVVEYQAGVSVAPARQLL